jgi:hypothetical protein
MTPRLGVGEIVDDAGELVASVAAPWLGLLWLTSIPLRLGQAHFASRILELGVDARQYGDHLHHLALVLAGAFLVSTWGRAVFVRACAHRLRALAHPGGAPLRLPAAAFLSYAYAALLTEVAFFATCSTFILAPFFVLVAGLAAATFPQSEGAGLVRPFVRIARRGTEVRPLAGLVLVFTAAFVLAAVNLYFVFQLGLWLAGGALGADTTRWSGLLAFSNPRLLSVVLAGGLAAVEPYWLAALVVYVHKLESRTTGEDLRLWFERLRSIEA